MNIYKLLKVIAGESIPKPVKLLGVWAMHMVRRRVIGIFIDPVNACNLRCKMCYFSDPEKRMSMKGMMTESQIDKVARALFHRALKLQIGCGTEPTLYPHIEEIVRRGKKTGIPFISLTTNGQLIADEKVSLENLCREGLNEITLSMHGTRRDTYEELMPGASYDKLVALIGLIEDAQLKYPGFTVRINFTVNSLNVDDLADDSFWRLWSGNGPDVIQLRPVQKIGESEWQDFSIEKTERLYDSTIGKMIGECHKRGVKCLAPSKDQLREVATEQDYASAVIEDLTYCYLSPQTIYKSDFDLSKETYESYHRRKRTASRLFASVFGRGRSRSRRVSKKLNYRVS